MRFVLLVALTLLAAACSKPVYLKDGMTREHFEADKLDCQQEVVTMDTGSTRTRANHATSAQQDVHHCLLRKGYHIVHEEDIQERRSLPPPRILQGDEPS
jgi:hypothetical protein